MRRSISERFFTWHGQVFPAHVPSFVPLYKRFVDDVLVITRSKVHTPDMLQALNSFDPLINCTQDGLEADDRVSFLDLDIDYSGGKLVYSTFRKPLATYNYTPADSCHPGATLLGIVATESVRLLRTNSTCEKFNFQRNFFASKLKLRGYNLKDVRKIFHKYPWHRRKEIIKPKRAVAVKGIVALKLPFSHFAVDIRASNIFRSYEHLIPSKVRSSLRPLLVWETSPNLFRLRYSRFR